MSALKPEYSFLVCKIAGFGLMLALWFPEGETAGFFLIACLAIMSLLRWRFPKLRATILLDFALCILVVPLWEYAHFALLFVLFEGMYRRFYWIALVALSSFYFVDDFSLPFALLLILAALSGLLLAQWEQAQEEKHDLRDEKASKYYDLKRLQTDLMTTLPELEHMTALTERARIARDIHDNAGHEIVAAYISLQAAREMLDGADSDSGALELYDAALDRLHKGVTQIRETAHNLQTVNSLGVESMLEVCENFPSCPVNFNAHGDTSLIPVYIWSVLEACLKESLTNVSRHAHASCVSVELDVTEHIMRLSIENDGAGTSAHVAGNGLYNLRQRATAVGGTISVHAGDHFRVVCVIPIQEGHNETSYS